MMKKRIISTLMAALILLTLLPVQAWADTSISERIRTTYESCLARAGVSSFNGNCGLYVNWQLVVLGINSSYVGAEIGRAHV